MLIVIHGTGAAGYTWWHFNSSFSTYLDQVTGGDLYKNQDQFSWTGGRRDSHRQTAADKLVDWLQAHPATYYTIVAHSHGGNVAMLATRKGAKIDRLILLGTPIRTDYTPDLRNVGLIYNVFSTKDLFQIGGVVPYSRGEGRTLGDSEKLVNVLVHRGHLPPPLNVHSLLHDENLWRAFNLDQLLL